MEPLLEREDELRRLTEFTKLARAGRGGILLVEGPAGIGKSSLLAAGEARAAVLGLQVLTARGAELETDFGFGVARQLLERRLSGADRATLLAGAARLGRPAIELGEGPAGDPQSVLHGLHWLSANLAEARPTLFVLDDAQWADAPSLRWLAYTARRLEGLALGLLIARRTAAGDEPGGPLDAIASEPAARTLRPAGLTEAAVAARLETTGEDVGADPEFARACFAATRGNPFLLTELLRAVELDGIPRTPAGAARIRELAPETISRAVVGRLSRLPAPANRVAAAVALLEPHATLARVAGLCALGEGEVLAALDALAAADVLAADAAIAFAHPILAAAVRAEIPPASRAAMHARAARQLAGDGAGAELVATHLGAAAPAGDPWVVEALVAAAAEAQARGALDTAVAHMERALAEPPVPARRFDVLTFLGTLEVGGRRTGAVAHLEEAVLAAAGSTQRTVAALALAQAKMVAGDLAAAQAALAAAQATAGADTVPELRMTLDAYALASRINGQTPPAVDARLDALGRDLTGASMPERLLLAQLAFCGISLGTPRAAVLPLVERSLRDGELDLDVPDPFAAMLPAQLLVFCDELERAERLLVTALARARERGLLSHFGFGSGARGILALRRGDLDLAETSAADATVADPRTLAFMVAPLAALEVGVALERRSPEAVQAALARAAAATTPSLGSATVLAYLHHARGVAALEAHEAPAAARHLEAADAVFGRVGEVSPAALPWRSDLARAYAALGRREDAVRLAVRELELARGFGAPRPIAIALRGLAAVSDEGRVERLEEAAAVAGKTEARLEHAYALAELGAALRRARRPAAARELLLDALERADRCGSRRLEASAREELAALGIRPRRAARTGHDALTPSEARVARMAAGGLSNPEIAQALYISRATVESHLARSYAKLGIGSRRELGGVLAGATVP